MKLGNFQAGQRGIEVSLDDCWEQSSTLAKDAPRNFYC
jgi:hypothetical protein